MTTKSRYFLVGSAAFMVLGLTVGLVAYYGGLPGLALGRSAGPDELAFVPKNAAVVAFANVRDVMGSELRQHIRAMGGEERSKGQQELRDELGIDIERDVDHVVACMTAEGGFPEKTGLVLATGTFDQGRIEAFIREKGGTAETYKGRTIFTHSETPADPVAEGNVAAEGRHGRGGSGALAFLKPGVVAMGGIGAVRQAIDVQAGGPNVTDNADMMRMIRTVESGNAWAVGRFDAIAGQAKLPEQVASQIPPINYFAASGHINGGLSGTVSVEARDEAAAQNLREVINGFVALARLQGGSKPEVQTMLQAIQLGGEAKTVTLSFTLPAQMLDLLKTMSGHGPKGTVTR